LTTPTAQGDSVKIPSSDNHPGAGRETDGTYQPPVPRTFGKQGLSQKKKYNSGDDAGCIYEKTGNSTCATKISVDSPVVARKAVLALLE